VSHHDLHAVVFLQPLDAQPIVERVGDRLLRVDVLFRFRDFFGDREVLLVGAP